MELHGKDVLALVDQSLVCSVIDIDEQRLCNGRIDRALIHRIAMVLGRDVYPSRRKILHRVVAAAMTVF